MPHNENGPGDATPQGRNDSHATVQPRSNGRHTSQRTTAYASVYGPCRGRSRWLAVYICPFCQSGHAAYARNLDEVPGRRRTRCGRLVRLIVARTYRGERAA